jgi:hypothetical protein
MSSQPQLASDQLDGHYTLVEEIAISASGHRFWHGRLMSVSRPISELPAPLIAPPCDIDLHNALKSSGTSLTSRNLVTSALLRTKGLERTPRPVRKKMLEADIGPAQNGNKDSTWYSAAIPFKSASVSSGSAKPSRRFSMSLRASISPG